MQTLRQRFNPDGSPLRKQQLRMLDMLVWFDKVCRSNDIPYWLCSGTLLGAVRHGGFIPWDDDLDISMMRGDYERFRTLIQKMPDAPFLLQDHQTDSGYFFSYGKLRDPRTYLEETNGYDRIFGMRGIYIDLLTFEKMPRWMNRIACASIGHSYKILRTSTDDQHARHKVERIYRFNARLLFPCLRLLAHVIPSRWLHRSPGIPYKSRTTKQEIFPLSTVHFEGHEFYAPHDTPGYLRRMFGNYMQLPPLDSIHPHTNCVKGL